MCCFCSKPFSELRLRYAYTPCKRPLSEVGETVAPAKPSPAQPKPKPEPEPEAEVYPEQ